MKIRYLKISVLLSILIIALSGVNAHGVDVTSDKMVIANDTNGQMVKDIADSNAINISVYKFTSSDEVEHQLEHMLNNSNKYIIVVSYQDTADEFLKNHPDMSSRLVVIDDVNNQTLKEEMIKAVNQEETDNDSSNMLLFYESGIVIVLLLIIGGILIVKQKKK